MMKNHPVQNISDAAVHILCFTYKKMEGIIYCGIHGFGDLRMSPGYLAHEYQGFSCRLIFSGSLSMSSVDSFETLLSPTLCEWKPGKYKRESAWQMLIPKKALLWCPRKKNQWQKTKQWHDYWVTSFWLKTDGSHSTSGGANCDIISDLLFLSHTAWFLFWLKLLLTANRPRKRAVLSTGKAIGMGKRGRVIRSGFELSTPAPAWWV